MLKKVTKAEKLDHGQVLAWMDKHWKQPRNCPICDAVAWNIDEEAVEVKVFRRGAFLPGIPVRALVIVTCNNCGYTIFFDAVIAGLISDQG